MRVPRLLTLVFAAAVALLGATAAQPTSGSGKRVLRLAAPVSGLAADGSVAVTTACGKRDYWFFAWNPVRQSSTLLARRACDEGNSFILAQGVAGRRIAWVPYDAGNESESRLVTATIGRPRSITPLTGFRVHGTDDGVGDWVGNIYGDGSLLVFNTWSECEKDQYNDSCPPGTPPGYHIYNENLWRIVGRRKQLLVASPDELTVLAVAAGRILVQRADGSLEIRRGSDGNLVRAFPFRHSYERVAVLDASELVVLDRVSGLQWRVYDPVSGAQKRVLRAPKGAIPADVERGLLVYTVGRVVHVQRLADGRQRTFAAPVPRSRYGVEPVLAQIEPFGLLYSYQVRRRGRVRFVPFNEIGFGR
ncbi:MAG TPA: hypothetical protein VK488_00715 [Gaiellaceae bacterium]|nr:hypothetical protein [Gaiellaceae bacterium]